MATATTCRAWHGYALALLLCAAPAAVAAESADAWFQQAFQAHVIESNAALAAQCLANTLAVDEDYIPALLELGILQAARGEDAAARHTLLRAVGNDPETELAVRLLSALDASTDDVRAEHRHLLALLPGITNGYLRLHIEWLLARHERVLGQWAEAAAREARLSPLTNWLVVGGFENTEQTGLQSAFGPEDDLSREQVYEGKQWPVTWREARPLDPRSGIALQILQPSRWITVYARTGLVAPTPTAAVLQVTFTGAFRVWLNGAPVAQQDSYRQFQPFNYRVPIELEAGTNVLVLKLCAKSNSEELYVNLTDAAFLPLTLAQVQPGNAELTPLGLPDGEWPEALESPGVERWRAMCAERAPTVYARVSYARYLAATDAAEEAIHTYEALLEDIPLSAADLCALGGAYVYKESPSQAIAAFRAACERDPMAVSAYAAIALRYCDLEYYDLAEPIIEQALAVASNRMCTLGALRELYAGREWDEDAYRVAEEIYRLYPNYGSSAETLAYAALDKNYFEEYEAYITRALELESDRTGNRYSLARRYLSNRQFDDFNAQLALLTPQLPTDPDIPWLKLSGLLAQRDLTNAYATCTNALQRFPDFSPFHCILGDIYYMWGYRSNAVAAYRQGLYYRPDYVWLRRYLDFLEGRDQTFFEQYAWTDEAVQKLVTEGRNLEDESGDELARCMLNQTLVQLYPDGSTRHCFHILFKVLNPRAVKSLSSVTLPVRNCQLLRAATHKLDGRVLEATHMTSSQIEFPDVQVGDVIEYKYQYDKYGTSVLDDQYSDFLLFDLHRSIIDYASYAIAAPSGLPMVVDVTDDPFVATTAGLNGTLVRQWTITNVPMAQPEPAQVPRFDLAPRICLTTITNWDVIANWERSMWRDVSRSERQVRELAERIAGDATSSTHAVALIFEYITGNFRYTQMRERLISAVKPHAIQEILANRCGDCKDLTLLMIELLRARGIRAVPAVVRTLDKGNVVTNVPSPAFFNHVMVYIPDLDGTPLFCDPTYRNATYDLLPGICQQVLAFVIDSDSAYFIRTPLAPAEDSMTSYRLDGTVEAAGMFTGQLTIDSYRNDAVDMRYLLERMPNIGNLASYFSSEIDPAAQVSDFSVTGRDPAEGPLSFSIALTAPQFGRSSGDRVTVRLPLPIDASAITHGLATRRYPMRLEQIGGEERSYSLRLPHGYEVHIPEPESELNTPFGTFTFAAHLDGNTLQVEWRFVLTQRLITPDAYPAFRAFLARCDHVTSQVVTLQPTGPALLMRPPE